MSIPYSIISCSSCDLSGSTLAKVGYFYWRDRQGRLAEMGREMGLCHNCDDIVAMEILPTSEAVEQAEFEASDHRSYNAKLTSFWGGLRNSLSSIPRKTVRISEPDVLKAVMALNRRPVCLSCGSPDVVPLAWPASVRSSNENLHRLGVRHARCVGELLIHGSGGGRAAPYIMARVYDLHGQMIEEVPRHAWEDRE